MVVGGLLILLLLNAGFFSQNSPPPMPDQISVQTPVQTPIVTLTPLSKSDIISADGLNQLHRNNSEGALKTYEEAIQLDPGSPVAWTGKGYALLYDGRYQDAIAAFDTALTINASYHKAIVGKRFASDALDLNTTMNNSITK